MRINRDRSRDGDMSGAKGVGDMVVMNFCFVGRI